MSVLKKFLLTSVLIIAAFGVVITLISLYSAHKRADDRVSGEEKAARHGVQYADGSYQRSRIRTCKKLNVSAERAGQDYQQGTVTVGDTTAPNLYSGGQAIGGKFELVDNHDCHHGRYRYYFQSQW